MRLYAAPMEGLTGYVFRNAHHACFPGTDAYFTPFVSPGRDHEFTSRELNDLMPTHNEGTPVIPQILTADPENFLWAAGTIADMGYDEVNLNLGCPSPTVVTKGKGSGMLADPESLDAFLDAVFSRAPVKISIKTRVGLNDAGNLPELIEIFSRYPIHELTVHPRIQADMYKKPVRPDAFAEIFRAYRGAVIYNGDLFTSGDIAAVAGTYSGITGVMCGRGLAANPWLFGSFRGLARPDAALLHVFHDMILEGYRATMPGDRALLFKLKELWLYMGALFPDRGSFDKKLRKTARLSEYISLTDGLFDSCAPDFSAAYTPR